MQDYDKYDQGDIHWQWYNNSPWYFKLVNESIEPFKDVELGTLVDIGCGDGLPLSLLHELGFKCYGVDPQYDGIDLALDHGVSAEYFVERAERFADRNLKFDYLYSLNTIEHMDDPQALVEIMKNVRNFGVVITDDGSKVDQVNRYHNVEFTRESFAKLFREFKIEWLQLTGDFIGAKIFRASVCRKCLVEDKDGHAVGLCDNCGYNDH